MQRNDNRVNLHVRSFFEIQQEGCQKKSQRYYIAQASEFANLFHGHDQCSSSLIIYTDSSLFMTEKVRNENDSLLTSLQFII